jgi:hypothetical protein
MEGVTWINLAEDRVFWKIFVDTVMNFRLQICNIFLDQLMDYSLSRKTMLHRVC